MTEATPPPLETKDLPYVGVPAAVPNPDRIGYETEAGEDDTTSKDDNTEQAAKPKSTTRGKATDKS